jgi:hypothetical protein
MLGAWWFPDRSFCPEGRESPGDPPYERAVCAARQAGLMSTKINPMVFAIEGIRALSVFY